MKITVGGGLTSVWGWSHTAEANCKGLSAFGGEVDAVLRAVVHAAGIVWERLAPTSKNNSSNGVGDLFVRAEFYTLVESAVLDNYF